MTSRYGFPKSVRLLHSDDFRRAQRGERHRGRDLVFKVLRHGEDRLRIGLAVSRKVGNAVVRNRVKRWIREAARHERGGLLGLDIVVIALPSAADSDAHSVRQQVARLMSTLRHASGPRR